MSASPFSPVVHSPMPEPLSMLPHDASLLRAVAPDEMPGQAYQGEQRRQSFSVPTPRPFLPPASSTISSASSALPASSTAATSPTKDTKIRRWSLASLFKDRRGSLPGNSINNNESSNQPPLPTPQPSSNRQDRRMVPSYEPPSPVSPSTMSHPQSSSSNNLLGLPPIGKRTSRDSPPGSQGSSRRSSLADIPKFLSSLRRGSASTGSDSSQPPTGSYQPPARVSGFMARNSICEENFLGGRGGSSLRDGDLAFGPSSPEEEYNSEGHEEDDAEYNAVFQGDDDPTLGPNVVARLATLKPPPKDVYSQGRPPKSILKKGCITAPGAINSSTAGGTGQAKNGVLNKKTGPNTGNSLSSASVHPMANDLGPNSWPPAVSHRANLVTRSPVPNHQQQQQHIQQFQKAHNCHTSLKLPEALSAATFHHQQQQEHTPPGFFHHSSANDSTHPLDNNAWNAPWSSASSHQGHGAAIPADIRGGGKEGAIAPCDRGGEPSQGDVEVQVTGPMARLHLRPQGMGDPYAPPTMNGDVQMNSGKPENDCKLVVMVVDPDNHVTARTTSQAQASGGAYLQSAPSTAIMGGGGQSGVYSAPPATIGARGSVISSQYQSKAAAAAAAAAAARRIGFLSTVEIIPAHRKSEYNRRSDKNATFKILTPDMKGEIRDELNAYKMREMAVHVESMGNTAFH